MPILLPTEQAKNTTRYIGAIRPIEHQAFDLDPDIVALGERLFNDVRLSGDDSIACANCHNLGAGGTDNQKFSIGINGQMGTINTPTLFNAAFNFKQFWDGRAQTLEEQVAGPINDPREMGSSWPQVIEKLSHDLPLINHFEALYPAGLTEQTISHAIATFERSLITPDSRFDRFLKGEKNILSQAELDGYQLFNELGCKSCHQGVNIGGNMFQFIGIMRNYFEDRGNITQADHGRFNVTRLPEDKFKFKVPSLRNIALTSPYFHDGSIATLEEAIMTMAYYQLGLELSEQQISLLTQFLNTLTGARFAEPHANPDSKSDSK